MVLSSSLVLGSCGGETATSGQESSKATTAEAGFASRVETVRKQAEALAKSAPGVIVSVRDGNRRKILAIGDAARNPERKAHAFQTGGRHTATVTVTDAHGHSAQATASVDVTAQSASAAPRITRLRVTPTHVQIGTRPPRLVRAAVKRPLGTISFRLSKPAKVTLRSPSSPTAARHARSSPRFGSPPARAATDSGSPPA